VIPYKVKTVGGYAFSGCSGLEKIRCLANSKPAGWSDDWDYGISAEVFWGLDKPRMWLTSLGNGIRLNWDAVSYATKYNVWRKAPGGSWENIGSSRSLTYTDKTAEAGTEYYYRIRAQVSKVYSPYSTTLSMLWLERPEAPKPVNAVSGVKLTWAEVKGADRYDIWRSEDGGGFIKIGHSHKASYIDKQAESGVVYQYKLKAVCQDTIYTSSSEESAKIVRLAAPETTIKAYASGIKLTWKTVPGATLYNIWRASPGGSFERIGTSRTLSYVDKTVVSGKTYRYYVTAQYSKYLSSHNAAVSAAAK
jgi:fibronectin type 3 domain-containing protein